MIDEIFKKLYKHKRYIPINESNTQTDYFNMIDMSYNNCLTMIKSSFINRDHRVLGSCNNYRILVYRPLDIDNVKIDTNDMGISNNINEYLLSLYQNIFQKNDISTITHPNIKSNMFTMKMDKNKGTIINCYPCIRYIFDSKTLQEWLDYIIYYKFSDFDNTQLDPLINSCDLQYETFDNIEQIINKFKEELFNLIYDANIIHSNNSNNSNNIDNELKYYITSDKSDGKTNGKITLAYSKYDDTIIGRLYTKQLIIDSLPRTMDVATTMIINSCDNLIDNLSNKTDNQRAVNALKFSHVEDNSKIIVIGNKTSSKSSNKKQTAYSKMLNNSSSENMDIINTTIQTVNCYKNATIMANNGNFTEDFINSKGLNKNLQVYLPEILSPFVLCHNGCSWSQSMGHSGLEAFRGVINSSADDFSDIHNKCYIGFYDSSTHPLADAFAIMNNKFIDISVKGGTNGQGAPASIRSLRKYIYQTDAYGVPTNKLLPQGIKLQNEYEFEFKIFDLLSQQRTIHKADILNILDGHYKYVLDFNQIDDSREAIANFINNRFNISSLILTILQSASFDIVQINARPTSTDNDFHFTYVCQYPAVFDGTVKIIIPPYGYTKFHIKG